VQYHFGKLFLCKSRKSLRQESKMPLIQFTLSAKTKHSKHQLSARRILRALVDTPWLREISTYTQNGLIV
jgi:hypothetical protein